MTSHLRLLPHFQLPTNSQHYAQSHIDLLQVICLEAHSLRVLVPTFPRSLGIEMAWRSQGITGSNNIPLGNRRRFGDDAEDSPAPSGNGSITTRGRSRGRGRGRARGKTAASTSTASTRGTATRGRGRGGARANLHAARNMSLDDIHTLPESRSPSVDPATLRARSRRSSSAASSSNRSTPAR